MPDDDEKAFGEEDASPSDDSVIHFDNEEPGPGTPDSVLVMDEEEALRESMPGSEPGDLAAVSARNDFAEAIAEAMEESAHVDADPAARDAEAPANVTHLEGVAQRHLRGLLEALLFVSDRPMKAKDLAEVARADTKEVRRLLEELSAGYRTEGRGFQLDELAGGWQLRTSPTFAPFVRELTALKPVRLSRAQLETLAIVAYRQPITRPEVEEVRGVDAGAVLKLLLDRDLVRVLGKKDEPGRPWLYGTTAHFLEFFGLKSLRDLPTLREFTELSEESRDVVERELGDEAAAGVAEPNVVGDASRAGIDEIPGDSRAPAPPLQEEAAAPDDTVDQGAAARGEDDGENDGLTPAVPGGKSYDPSDEELYPDDDDSDDDDDEEEDDEEDEDDDRDEAEDDGEDEKA